MEAELLTSRLKLTWMDRANRGSQEFDWLHEMRSDEKCTFWSISGRSKTPEDTEKFADMVLPRTENTQNSEEARKPKSYRVAYAVHELLPPTNTNDALQHNPSRFIGLVTIKSISGPNDLVLPAAYTDPTTQNPNTLSIEVAYQFLPQAWGKGYATEAVGAVFNAAKNASSFWTPYKIVYVRAIVNEKNPASQSVMRKLDMDNLGTWEKTGLNLFLGGEWIEKSRICIFGKYLLKGSVMAVDEEGNR